MPVKLKIDSEVRFDGGFIIDLEITETDASQPPKIVKQFNETYLVPTAELTSKTNALKYLRGLIQASLDRLNAEQTKLDQVKSLWESTGYGPGDEFNLSDLPAP